MTRVVLAAAVLLGANMTCMAAEPSIPTLDSLLTGGALQLSPEAAPPVLTLSPAFAAAVARIDALTREKGLEHGVCVERGGLEEINREMLVTSVALLAATASGPARAEEASRLRQDIAAQQARKHTTRTLEFEEVVTGQEDRVGFSCEDPRVLADLHTHPKSGSFQASSGDFGHWGASTPDTVTAYMVSAPFDDTASLVLDTIPARQMRSKGEVTPEQVARLAHAFASIPPQESLPPFAARSRLSMYLTCGALKLACYVRTAGQPNFVKLSGAALQAEFFDTLSDDSRDAVRWQMRALGDWLANRAPNITVNPVHTTEKLTLDIFQRAFEAAAEARSVLGKPKELAGPGVHAEFLLRQPVQAHMVLLLPLHLSVYRQERKMDFNGTRLMLNTEIGFTTIDFEHRMHGSAMAACIRVGTELKADEAATVRSGDSQFLKWVSGRFSYGCMNRGRAGKVGHIDFTLTLHDGLADVSRSDLWLEPSALGPQRRISSRPLKDAGNMNVGGGAALLVDLP